MRYLETEGGVHSEPVRENHVGVRSVTMAYKYLNLKKEPWCLQFDQNWTNQMQTNDRFCTLCGTMRTRDIAHPVDAVLRKPPLKCNDHSGTIWGICIIKRDLLSAIQLAVPEVPWCVGRCSLSDGREVETHCTAFSTNLVHERHYPFDSISVCPICRTVRTKSKDTKPYYLMSHEVRGHRVVVDRIGSIFVAADVAEAIPLWKRSGLYWQDIEVKDLPEDGLRFPGDPPYIRGREIESYL